jgi:nitrite reductase/ring-hydroxylating ferredoxin subunit
VTSDTNAHRRLCRIDELEDPGDKGFSVDSEGTSREILLIRLGSEVYGYLNSCPHTGAPLDWAPGRFLDQQREFIQCAMHGALFRISDGLCVFGPCAGDRLAPVSVTVMDGDVILASVDTTPERAKE